MVDKNSEDTKTQKKLPNIAFTYWSGDSLTWLHILTLRTLIAFNPNKRIILYTTDTKSVTSERSFLTREHKLPLKFPLGFDTLSQFENLEIVSLDLQREFGISSLLFHTYIADLVRIKKLEEHGGIWFDMDVLFLDKIPECFESLPLGKECFTMSYSGAFATGFMGGYAHAEVFKKVLDEALSLIATQESNFESKYQVLGPHLWRHCTNSARNPHSTLCLFDHNLIYPYLPNEMSLYFEQKIESRCSSQTKGVHWYNGSTVAHTFLNAHKSAVDVLGEKTPIAQDLRVLQSKQINLEM